MRDSAPKGLAGKDARPTHQGTESNVKLVGKISRMAKACHYHCFGVDI
jgi:hypothetical protein